MKKDNIHVGACKKCSACAEVLSLEKFSKRSKSPDGLQGTCKGCSAKSMAVWRAKNAESIKKYASAHSKAYRAANLPALLAKRKDYYAANREISIEKTTAWQRANKPAVNLKNREWNRKNPENYRGKNMRRLANKRNASPIWASKDRIDAFYESAHQLSMLTGEWYNVDHIVPLQSKIVCGLHCEQNLQILTRLENIQKSNKFWPDMP